MSQTGKIKNLFSAFSLVEIIVSLAIFSVIITGVLTISISMLNAQKKIQEQLFLAQTAQTTLELMSRQLRYGYNYTGSTLDNYNLSEGGETITLSAKDTTTSGGTTGSTAVGSSASSSVNLVNAANSPFVLFEGENGNPNDLTDQNAFCAYKGKLYKITKFEVQTTGTTYTAKCDSGSSMLPDDIILDNISFDVYGDSSETPKNPMVRIKMRLSHPEDGVGAMEVQTTVTQRLVSYF